MIIVKELYVNAVTASISVGLVSLITVFVFYKQTRLVKAMLFALVAAFVAMGMPYVDGYLVFPHFVYFGAAYFGGLPALLLSIVSGQTVAALLGNVVVGMPRSVLIAAIWGLVASKGVVTPRWQEAIVGLWPAALFLTVPGSLPGEALLSAGGMVLSALLCWYLALRGYSYSVITAFLRTSGYVMFIDGSGVISYTSPVLAQKEALSASLGQELMAARRRGLGQAEVGEAEIACEVAGERKVFLLRVSRLTLPMADSGWMALFRDVTAIKSAQSQLQQFFDLSLHGFAVLHVSGEVLWVNQAVAQMLERSESDLVGKNFLDFISPRDISELADIWQALASGNMAPRYGKVRVITAKGRELWLSWSGVYSPTENAVHVVVHNIHQYTERQERLVQQIRQHSNQARLLNLVQEAILVYDLSLRLLSANEAAGTLYATDFNNWRHVQVDDLLATRYPQPLGEIKEQLLTAGHWQGVICRTTQEGRPLIILARWTLSRSATGEAVKIIEICSDYTTALQDAQRRRLLAAVVESTDDGVVSLAEDSTVLTWNKGAEQILGYTASEIVGRRLQELCLPEAWPAVDAALAAARSGHTTEGCRDVLPHKAGTAVYTSAVFSPLGGAEPALRTISMLVNDVTAQRLMEREKLRVDRVNVSGQIAAGLGHELRNSLTTVRGFLQLFRTYPAFEVVKSQLDIVQDDLLSAQKVVTSFLALAGFSDMAREPAQLNNIVAEAVPLLVAEGLKNTHHIKLAQSATEQLLLCTSCIRQLVTNLARNGLQAMPEGGTLTIATEQTESSILLLIKDEGTGIDQNIHDKVWTPFFTTRPGHSGLGLTVCESIAVLHNATISFMSTPLGTIFTVAFPRELKEEGSAPCS